MMATRAQWIEGARLRTLSLAIAPVLVGTGAAIAENGGLSQVFIGSLAEETTPSASSFGNVVVRFLLALVLSLGLQIGTNYANDYSDGIRGTDDTRVGPQRLTASGAAPAAHVKRAAFLSFGVAGLAGAILVIISQSWWLIPVGIAAILAAWYYTGGKKPYGYHAMGEIFVFVFFGLVATLGTMYTQVGTLSLSGAAGAVGIGLLSCAVLMVNNIRDIPTDAEVGKRTLAVVVGDRTARTLYALWIFVPYLLLLVPILVGYPAAVLAILSLVVAVSPLQVVLSGTTGKALIPPIKHTSLAALVYGLLLGLGLAL